MRAHNGLLPRGKIAKELPIVPLRQRKLLLRATAP